MSEVSEVNKNRPEFRNIHITDIARYRMPLSALVSILHRVSGALIFLLLPFILYLLDQSMSEMEFYRFQECLSQWWMKLVLLALSWAYLHHFCAGLRHVVMDTHRGLDKQTTRRSAASVLVLSLALTVVVGLKLFGVF